ncbi:MAG: MFS transporter [Chloroflexi bacterium]|jgi:MFS family permease|nr:MFS transporter [Chloroflexota bacterium]
MQTTTKKEKKEPLLSNILKLFMFAMVLANIAGSMYGSLLPLYLKSLNANVLQVGLFFTLSNILPLILQILGGWISDSLGRLRSIAMGSVAGVIAHIGIVLAPTWQWVLFGEGFGAITRSLVGPSFSSFIADQSAEKNRARVFGITESIFMLVVVIGPPLGGWLADAYGFKFMLIIAAVLYTFAALIRIGMARTAAKGAEANPEKLSLASLKEKLSAMTVLLLAGGVMTWVLVTDGVRDIAYTMSFTLESLYLNEIGGLTMKQIGFLGSIFGICNMITTIPAGKLADKKGERVAIAGGFLLDAIGLIIFLNVYSFWGYAIAWGVFGIGVGLMSPAYQSLISKAVPEKLRGTAFGLLHSSLGLFSLPAPAIGARLWTRYTPQTPFRITAGVALLTIIPVWLKFKLPDDENEEK